MSEDRLTLLIDTDIIAYRLAASSESKTAFGVAVDDIALACSRADDVVTSLVGTLDASHVIMCLSDKDNFRYDVLPSYKHNRQDTLRPELLQGVKDYLADEYVSRGYPTLEADDVMGILATHPYAVDGRKIIVSEDKDMRTIPCELYAPHRPELGVIDVSKLDADRFLMWQTICGDTTDGYGGAKGIGKNSEWAKDVIFADKEDLWDIVLCAYGSKGLTEEDALQQARVARILRAEDYNIKTKELTLWTPDLLLA